MAKQNGKERKEEKRMPKEREAGRRLLKRSWTNLVKNGQKMLMNIYFRMKKISHQHLHHDQGLICYPT